MHTYRAVFVDDVGATVGEVMELHFVGHALAEIFKPGTHQLLQFGESMNVKRGSTPQEAESGDESHESEAMVAMEVGDEDVAETRETESYAAILALRTFATVNHIEFVAQVDNLRCGVVARGGQG